MVFIAEGIPCGNILKPYRSGDITGVGTFDFLAVVRMHLEDTAYTFLLSFCGIQDVSSLLHDPGVYTEECQFADKRVSHDFECESRHRCLVTGFTGYFFTGLRVCPFNSGNIGRCRQVIQHRIQKHLDAFVLVCGTAEYGEQVTVKSLPADRSFNFFNTRFNAFKVFFHQGVVAFCSLFNDFVTVFFHKVFHIFRNLTYFVLCAVVGKVDLSLSFEKIDNTCESILFTDRQLHSQRIGMKTVFHGLHRTQEICADRIHLVDERDTRYMVMVSLSPNSFRLGLHTVFRTEYSDRSVKYAEGTFYFYCEIYVPGVSMILTRYPFQWQVVAAEVIVMPRSCSCSIQSMVAAPS